jgi:hypothetical protein
MGGRGGKGDGWRGVKVGERVEKRVEEEGKS